MARQLSDLTDLEKLALIPLSYSRLSTLEACDLKYYYTYIIKEPRVFGPAATLGNVLHSVLEEHAGQDWKFSEIVNSYYAYREEYDPDHLISDELMAAGLNMLTEYIDRHGKELELEILAKEMPFNYVVGRSLLNGYIDLVVRENGRINVTDYKSGKHKQGKPETNLQLGIYALAVSLEYPGEDIYAELYYLRSGKREGCLFPPEKLAEVEARLLELTNDLVDKQNFPPTENQSACYWCDFATNKVCPVGSARRRR